MYTLLWIESLYNDRQQFNQYQQNEQPAQPTEHKNDNDILAWDKHTNPSWVADFLHSLRHHILCLD